MAKLVYKSRIPPERRMTPAEWRKETKRKRPSIEDDSGPKTGQFLWGRERLIKVCVDELKYGNPRRSLQYHPALRRTARRCHHRS